MSENSFLLKYDLSKYEIDFVLSLLIRICIRNRGYQGLLACSVNSL